jgi:hypothetical protein
MRILAARHPLKAANYVTNPATGPVSPSAALMVPASIACLYCRNPIPLGGFEYWSTVRRLLFAVCPTCFRKVTVTASTWRRARPVDAGAPPAARPTAGSAGNAQ